MVAEPEGDKRCVAGRGVFAANIRTGALWTVGARIASEVTLEVTKSTS